MTMIDPSSQSVSLINEPHLVGEADLAAIAFLARYSGAGPSTPTATTFATCSSGLSITT